MPGIPLSGGAISGPTGWFSFNLPAPLNSVSLTMDLANLTMTNGSLAGTVTGHNGSPWQLNAVGDGEGNYIGWIQGSENGHDMELEVALALTPSTDAATKTPPVSTGACAVTDKGLTCTQ